MLTRKVEIFQIVSGPTGTLSPGDKVALPAEEAAQLVAAHCARYIDEGPKDPQQKATAKAKENASAGSRKKKKKARRRRGS